MIVKNLKWKRFSPGVLIRYINNVEKTCDTTPIYWNVSQCSTNGVYQDLVQNNQYLNVRANSNRLLHDILSFSPEDTPYLNEDKVRALTYQYLRIKAPKNIAYGRIHKNKHWHVHLLLSPNELYHSKVTHHSKKEFYRIRKDLEHFQKAQYPELVHSIVFLQGKGKSKAPQQSEAERQFQKRTKSPSATEKIAKSIKKHLDHSDSMDAFTDRLLQYGYVPYEYRNKVNGIVFNQKKYRFSRLGITKAMLQSLDRKENREVQKRLRELEQLNQSTTKTKGLWR